MKAAQEEPFFGLIILTDQATYSDPSTVGGAIFLMRAMVADPRRQS